MTEQKIVKVTAAVRKQIALTTSTNRRMAQNWQAERQRKKGRAACSWCGSEPCGHLWTRPGGAALGEAPGGSRCCEKCSHESVEGWQHTHSAWDGGAHHAVCAIPMAEGDMLYMRRDGVVMFVELGGPPVQDEDGKEVDAAVRAVSVAMLGKDGGSRLYSAGEGGESGVNLWEFARELDVFWLQARMLSAVAKNDARKAAIAARQAAIVAENDRLLDLRMKEDEERRKVSIEKRALAHETRIVMDELVVGDDAELDTGEEAIAMPPPSDGAPAAEEPAAPVNLKEPVPVKKVGSGRPKRSFRQRRARERQKRAWAREEARSRLEVKRLERLARNRDKTW